VRTADRIRRWDGPVHTGCGIVVRSLGVAYDRVSQIRVGNRINEGVALSQGSGAGHRRHGNIDMDEVGIVGRELQRSVVTCSVDIGDVRGTQPGVRHRRVVEIQINSER